MSTPSYDVVPQSQQSKAKHGEDCCAHIGTVINTEDPQRLGRVHVGLSKPPGLRVWAYVVAPSGGSDRGCYFPPQQNDKVVVLFGDGDSQQALVVGCLWQGGEKPPGELAAQEYVIKSGTRGKPDSGHTIRLRDKPDNEKIEIVFNGGKNRFVIEKNKITIESEGDLELFAKGTFRVEAGTIELTAQAETVVNGKTVDVLAGAKLTLSGHPVDINPP
jgi:uncharacterized protein involved in type VI secretion and phage assembly